MTKRSDKVHAEELAKSAYEIKARAVAHRRYFDRIVAEYEPALAFFAASFEQSDEA